MWLKLFLAILLLPLFTTDLAYGQLQAEKGRALFGDTFIQQFIDSFSKSQQSYLTLTSDMILISLLLATRVEKFRHTITDNARKILHLQLPTKVAYFILVVLVATFVLLTFDNLTDQERYGDLYYADDAVENFPEHFDWMGVVKVAIIFTSQQVFGDIGMIPYLGSLSLLVVTYFFVLQFTGNRVAGLISVAVLVQSTTLLNFSGSAVRDSIWVLLYLLSLLVVRRKWYLSPTIYVLSYFSKVLVISYLPLSLFYLYRSSVSIDTKIKAIIPYCILLIGGLVFALFISRNISLEPVSLPSFSFLVRSLSSYLSYDSWIMPFFLPVITGLFLHSRRGILKNDSIIFLIIGITISYALLAVFTDNLYEYYRLIPMVVFLAIGTGCLFVRSEGHSKKSVLSIMLYLFSASIIILMQITLFFPSVNW